MGRTGPPGRVGAVNELHALVAFVLREWKGIAVYTACILVVGYVLAKSMGPDDTDDGNGGP